MSTNIVPVLTRNDISIEFAKDKPISLTQLWKMAKSPVDQTPAHWRRLTSTKKLVTRVCAEENMLRSHDEAVSGSQDIIKVTRGGKNPETVAHYKLAIEYAAYLDVEFKSWMLGIIGDYIAEPEKLAVESFDRIKDPKKIVQTKARIDGIAARKLETNAFEATGLVKESWQYGTLTNATYIGLLGADAKTLKSEMGLKPKQSLRDNLDDECLAAIRLSEIVAARKASEASSFEELKYITYQQASKIRTAIA